MSDAIETLYHQIKNLSDKIERIPDNEESLENIANSVAMLTDKLHGVGLEIYHLNSTIASLNIAIKDLVEVQMGD
jgi:prefoldin subunit 5